MNKQTERKITAMTEGGAKMGATLQELMDYSQPGVSLIQVEELAMKRIKESGGLPSFTTVEDYKWATCLCVNDVIVHGIPTERVLVEGDLFTIDVGMIYKGYHTDTAWSKIIGSPTYVPDSKTVKFLDTGKQALREAIAQARAGNRIGHISQTIQKIVEGSGYGIVKSLVGHGVGEELHMPPQIPGYLRGSVNSTLPLLPGMTIAIEIIYAMGNPAVYYANDDGWSIATRDHSLSACFEQTILITDAGPKPLTPAPKA